MKTTLEQFVSMLKRFDFVRECPHNHVYVSSPGGGFSVRIEGGSGGGLHWVLSAVPYTGDLARGRTHVTLATELAKRLG
jgi:hypothetical protein